MSKKFIILLGVFVQSFKSVANESKEDDRNECSAVEKRCKEFITRPEFQNLRTLKEWGKVRDLFCRVFRVEMRPPGAPAVDKCLELLNNESVPLSSVCEQSTAVMRDNKECR